MIEFICVVLLGLLVGIALGLFSVFPIYFAGFAVYAVHQVWTPELLLVFWATSVIGSQFFGSVSTITLGIPGEASALVYVDSIKQMSLNERNQLLYHTAKGSLFAGLVALAVVWFCYHYIMQYSYMLGSVNFTLGMFGLVIAMFAVTDKRPAIAILLLLLGTFIGPVNNFALPSWWYKIQLMFESAGFFMLVASLMLIPDLLFDRANLSHIQSSSYKADPSNERSWWTIIKSTGIGLVSGLVPGPAAETASALAYHAHKKKGIFQQVVAAETANNPGVVMMLLPFFTMGVPITASALLISNVLDIKNVEVIEFATEQSLYFAGLTIFDVVIATASVATLFYFILSTRFIDIYVKIVKYMYSKSSYLLFIIVGTMLLVDMSISETPIWLYTILVGFFTGAGCLLKYLRVNPILFIFGVMFGDKLIWTVMQFTAIHF
jgi:putative tricarboxylic transport membrane protein